MQVQMTERDKRLVVILSIIVIVVGFGWWGIRPAIKDNAKMSKEIEKQRVAQQVNDAKLSKLFMYETEAETYEEYISGVKDHFFPIMSSSEIDRLFTNMVLERGLAAYDLSIRIGSQPVPVEPYQYSALAVIVADEAERLKNESDSSGSSEEDPFEYTSSVAYNSEVYGVDISMRLAGEMEDLKGLIEDISKHDQLLLVRNVVWTEQVSMVNDYDAETGEYLPTMQSTTVLNLNLTLYMCDQSEPVEETEEAEEE